MPLSDLLNCHACSRGGGSLFHRRTVVGGELWRDTLADHSRAAGGIPSQPSRRTPPLGDDPTSSLSDALRPGARPPGHAPARGGGDHLRAQLQPRRPGMLEGWSGNRSHDTHLKISTCHMKSNSGQTMQPQTPCVRQCRFEAQVVEIICPDCPLLPFQKHSPDLSYCWSQRRRLPVLPRRLPSPLRERNSIRPPLR